MQSELQNRLREWLGANTFFSNRMETKEEKKSASNVNAQIALQLRKASFDTTNQAAVHEREEKKVKKKNDTNINR